MELLITRSSKWIPSTNIEKTIFFIIEWWTCKCQRWHKCKFLTISISLMQQFISHISKMKQTIGKNFWILRNNMFKIKFIKPSIWMYTFIIIRTWMVHFSKDYKFFSPKLYFCVFKFFWLLGLTFVRCCPDISLVTWLSLVNKHLFWKCAFCSGVVENGQTILKFMHYWNIRVASTQFSNN